MNYIIENDQSVVGIVEEVHENSKIIYFETGSYPNGTSCEVSLNLENKDSYKSVSVGDEVIVYYNAEITESSLLQINTVHANTLKTPVNRESK